LFRRDRRDGRVRVAGVLDVVVTDDGDVLGDAQSAAGQGVQGTQGHQVAVAEDRVGRLLQVQQLNNDKLFPLTVGLQSWYQGALVQSGANTLFTLVIAGSLVAIIPLIVAFLLQRYWRGGLTVGSLK
jgi:hypothetical protein